MKPDELKKLEDDLKQHESLLNSCQEELDRRTADMGKAAETSPPAQNPSSTPAPSTYVASIKTHVPLTLDLCKTPTTPSGVSFSSSP